MLILRCTEKLLRALPKQTSVSSEVEDDALVGSWFADLIRYDRRRCLLATNSRTLYSLFIPCLQAGDLSDLPGLFRRGLAAAIGTEDFADAASRYLDGCHRDSMIARTNNRRVLGSMIDLRYEVRAFLDEPREVGAAQMSALGQALNRVPMSYLEYGCAVDHMRAMVYHEAL
jgi:hypothetical protein